MNAFTMLDRLIEDVRGTLESTSVNNRVSLLVPQSIVHAAGIALHHPFAQTRAESRRKARESGRVIAHLIVSAPSTDSHSEYIDPIMGVSGAYLSPFTCGNEFYVRQCG